VLEVDLELLRGDVEDEDEHADVLEDVIALRLKVLLHEAILTTTIPQGEHEVAKESHSLLVDIHSECDLVGISGQVVGENDTSHGCLAGGTTAHQEDFGDVFLTGLTPRVTCFVHHWSVW